MAAMMPGVMPLRHQALDLQPFIRSIPDFPKPGILFRDINPLLSSPQATAEMLASPSVSVNQRWPFLSWGLETVASTRNLGAKPRSSRLPTAVLSSATEKLGIRSALKTSVGETPVEANHGADHGHGCSPGLVELGCGDGENHQGTAQQPGAITTVLNVKRCQGCWVAEVHCGPSRSG